MNLKLVNFLTVVHLIKIVYAIADANNKPENPKVDDSIINVLTDEKWDQIQKGQWLVEL